MAGYTTLLAIASLCLFSSFAVSGFLLYVWSPADETSLIEAWLEEHGLHHYHVLFKDLGFRVGGLWIMFSAVLAGCRLLGMWNRPFSPVFATTGFGRVRIDGWSVPPAVSQVRRELTPGAGCVDACAGCPAAFPQEATRPAISLRERVELIFIGGPGVRKIRDEVIRSRSRRDDKGASGVSLPVLGASSGKIPWERAMQILTDVAFNLITEISELLLVAVYS
ncbi:hypothetical protein AAG570_006767 [Ranatra chinensis]|uniref:Uncharacterized protein n=1 Tax=Ranatra chinensis TaxID=642074 RepID=A0ABD0YV06_9HEMI